MADVWRSHERHYCKICDCWLSGHKRNILNHERSERHQENQKRHMISMQRRERDEDEQKRAVQRELRKIERAAAGYTTSSTSHVYQTPPVMILRPSGQGPNSPIGGPSIGPAPHPKWSSQTGPYAPLAPQQVPEGVPLYPPSSTVTNITGAGDLNVAAEHMATEFDDSEFSYGALKADEAPSSTDTFSCPPPQSVHLAQPSFRFNDPFAVRMRSGPNSGPMVHHDHALDDIQFVRDQLASGQQLPPPDRQSQSIGSLSSHFTSSVPPLSAPEGFRKVGHLTMNPFNRQPSIDSAVISTTTKEVTAEIDDSMEIDHPHERSSEKESATPAPVVPASYNGPPLSFELPVDYKPPNASFYATTVIGEVDDEGLETEKDTDHTFPASANDRLNLMGTWEGGSREAYEMRRKERKAEENANLNAPRAVRISGEERLALLRESNPKAALKYQIEMESLGDRQKIYREQILLAEGQIRLDGDAGHLNASDMAVVRKQIVLDEIQSSKQTADGSATKKKGFKKRGIAAKIKPEPEWTTISATKREPQVQIAGIEVKEENENEQT